MFKVTIEHEGYPYQIRVSGQADEWAAMDAAVRLLGLRASEVCWENSFAERYA